MPRRTILSNISRGSRAPDTNICRWRIKNHPQIARKKLRSRRTGSRHERQKDGGFPISLNRIFVRFLAIRVVAFTVPVSRIVFNGSTDKKRTNDSRGSNVWFDAARLWRLTGRDQFPRGNWRLLCAARGCNDSIPFWFIPSIARNVPGRDFWSFEHSKKLLITKSLRSK